MSILLYWVICLVPGLVPIRVLNSFWFMVSVSHFKTGEIIIKAHPSSFQIMNKVFLIFLKIISMCLKPVLLIQWKKVCLQFCCFWWSLHSPWVQRLLCYETWHIICDWADLNLITSIMDGSWIYGALEPKWCLYQVCFLGVDHKCHCPVFYKIRGRYHCLFRGWGFGPLKV